MSMSEPFLPAHEPRSEPDPREHDVDAAVDVLLEPTESDSAVEAVAVHESAPRPPFRTPTPGDHLTPDELADDLATVDDDR